MQALEVHECDEIGHPTGDYLITSNKDAVDRIDSVPVTVAVPLAQRLLAVFLPSGYPHTVSSDYTAYQIYDSLQAFSSAIAGLIASRAVLQGLGVGDENATATAAMLLNVLQESMGRLATILFAHWGGRRIEAECKMYRIAADVFNDAAFVMDCLSPSLPKPIRVPLLCASSMSRAICGVAGGSSKAILSSHFARADNIGELNAKDSSQETVISLLGMWAGGAVVSHITSPLATWTWLLVLLTVHLLTNAAAVRAICMTTLNRQRANLAFSALQASGKVLNPAEVASQERLFEKDGVLRWQGAELIGACEIGVPFERLLQNMEATKNGLTLSIKGMEASTRSLLDVFAREDYTLWFNPRTSKATVILFDKATVETQLKAWFHALQVARLCKTSEQVDGLRMLRLLRDTILSREEFSTHLSQLEKVGWSLATVSLESQPGRRITVGR